MECFFYENKLQFGGLKTGSGGVRLQAQVLGPLECTIANKLIQHSTDRDNRTQTTSALGAEVTPSPNTAENQTFKLHGGLLHGGQGNDITIVNFAFNHDIVVGPAGETHASG